jgi:chromosome segregation ATPase
VTERTRRRTDFAPTACKGPFVTELLEILGSLYPPRYVVQAGCGPSPAEFALWQRWQVPRVLCVDHNANALAALDSTLPGLVRTHACLAASTGTATLVRSRLAAEDALLSEAALLAVWPHVQDVRAEELATTTLDTLLESANDPIPPDWLMLDCHPAGELLAGAMNALRNVRVLWVAVALEPIEHWPTAAQLSEVTALASKAGLKCVWKGSGLNPRLGHALFARDPMLVEAYAQAQIARASQAEQSFAELQTALSQQQEATHGLEAQVQNLATELLLAQQQASDRATEAAAHQTRANELANESAAHQQQATALAEHLAAESHAKQALAEELAAAREQVSQLEQGLAHAQQQANDRATEAAAYQTRASELANESAAHQQRAAALEEQLSAESQAKQALAQELAAAREQITQLEQGLAQAQQQASDRATEAATHQARAAELAAKSAAHHQQVAALAEQLSAKLAAVEDLKIDKERITQLKLALNLSYTRIDDLSKKNTQYEDVMGALQAENAVQIEKGLRMESDLTGARTRIFELEKKCTEIDSLRELRNFELDLQRGIAIQLQSLKTLV